MIPITSQDASNLLPPLPSLPSLLDLFPDTPVNLAPSNQSALTGMDIDQPASSSSGSSTTALGLDVAHSSFDPPPAIISLGEEITDETMFASDWSRNDTDDMDQGDSFFASSPSSCSSMSMSPDYHPQSLPLWQEEQARLLRIRNSVLDSEREIRHREQRLECEVARIKEDLARVKDARARARWAQYTSATKSAGSCSSFAAAAGPSSRPYSYDDECYPASLFDSNRPQRPYPHTAATTDLHHPDPETVLVNYLSEARSARAEERLKRRREHERIKELGLLLTLGSEVRQWEERLAWAQGYQLETSRSMDMDMDPRKSKRLSRSVPATPPSSSSVYNHLSSSSPTRSGPPSPALPSLSSSPLWRVSAEMILRRRSFSERPRRQVPPSPTPVAPKRAATAPASLVGGRRYPVPPPIAIPAYTACVTVTVTTTAGSSEESSLIDRGAKLDTANNVASCSSSSALSSSHLSMPKRPSGLKNAFTLDDLVAESSSPCAATPVASCDMSDEEESSSSGSESDDSRKSSSEEENRKGKDEVVDVRRGRARFSWRKSLTLNGAAINNAMVVDADS